MFVICSGLCARAAVREEFRSAEQACSTSLSCYSVSPTFNSDSKTISNSFSSRSSQTHHILANELVPGDLISFTTGDRIPADIRIISAVDLEIDESSLTGETEARSKNANTCDFDTSSQGHGGINGITIGEPVALADRTCIAYMGTLVRNGMSLLGFSFCYFLMHSSIGRGTGIVIATGTSTEFGIIFSMMQDVEEKRTPLQLSMDELAQKLSILSFGVIGVICLIGVLQQRSWLDMFTIGGKDVLF